MQDGQAVCWQSARGCTYEEQQYVCACVCLVIYIYTTTISKFTIKCSNRKETQIVLCFCANNCSLQPRFSVQPKLGPPSLKCVPRTPVPRLQKLSCVVHHSFYLLIFHIPEIFSYRKSNIKYQGIHNTRKQSKGNNLQINKIIK